MTHFVRVSLLCSLGFHLALHGQAASESDDLTKIVVTVTLDGADIRAVQEELNRQLPDIMVNLECDQRDVGQITLHVQDSSLSKLLDDVCHSLHYEWSYDSPNRSINLFPTDTKRYAYYPFGLTVTPIDMQGGDLFEVFGYLQNSPLLKGKYNMLFSFGYNEEVRKRWKRFHGTLENMSLRQALNWLCANHGRNTCWQSGYSSALGLQTFGFGGKYTPKNLEGAPAK